jgi:hypothetical protein
MDARTGSGTPVDTAKGSGSSRNGLRWSEGDLRRLRAFADRKTPFDQIAKRLGRTLQSIRWKAERLGITEANSATLPRGRAAVSRPNPRR